MRRLWIALFCLMLMASPCLAATVQLTDLATGLIASAGDQHRVDGRPMETASIVGQATCAAAASLKIGVYTSVDGTTWQPMANPLGTAPADSAVTFSRATAGTINVNLPLWAETKTGATWSRIPEINYPRIKVVVTNNGTVTLSGIKFWVVYH